MGRVLPLVMSLSTGLTIGHYREILQTVKMNIRRVTGHIFSPTMVISDFENSLLIAVQTELRNARVKGCYFHFCQSLWRKIQNLGLARHYVRHVRLRRCLRKLMALAYLPVLLVRLHTLVTSASTQRLIRRHPALGDFIRYLERNYFQGNFPPAMWNVFQRDTDTRTNNHVEG